MLTERRQRKLIISEMMQSIIFVILAMSTSGAQSISLDTFGSARVAGALFLQSNSSGESGNNSSSGNGSVSIDFAFFASTSMLNSIVDPDCESDCCRCVADASAGMVVNATSVALDACLAGENLGNNMFVLCNMIQEQPDLAVGMLISQSDIVQQSNAFCVGAGACPLPVRAVANICPTIPDLQATINGLAVAGFFNASNDFQADKALRLSYIDCVGNTTQGIMNAAMAVDEQICSRLGNGGDSGSTETTEPPDSEMTGDKGSNGWNDSYVNADNSTDFPSGSQTTASPGGSTTQPGDSDNQTETTDDPCVVYVRNQCSWRASYSDVYWGQRFASVDPISIALAYCSPLVSAD